MGQIVNDIEEIIDNKQEKKEAKSERQQILQEMQGINEEKTNLIKKTLAAQRAKFGAAGNGDGMSNDAVLKRLQEETSEPFEEKMRTATEKLKKIKKPKSNLLKSFITEFDSLL